MFTKRFSRPAVFAWTPSTAPVQGLVVADSAQQFDPTGSSRLDFVPIAALYQRQDDVFESNITVQTTHRFNEIVITSPFSSHSHGICVGGAENGHVTFFDLHKLVEGSKIEVLSSRRDHQGHVLSVSLSQDQRWALTGGGNGQLLLWDLQNLQQPYSPGTPNFNDQVKVVRWNVFMGQVAASLSSHRCSLWDVRRPGAPTLELAEVGGGVDWSSLCWSPSTDMKLVTASQADSVPLLALWDLRYPTGPVREARPHARGITSAYWHSRDSRLLLTAGRDGDMLITDPESGTRLGSLPSVHGDWVRAMASPDSTPNLLALSTFQHPLQVVNFDSFGSAAQGQPNGTVGGAVELTVIPGWSSAPAAGARFAFGSRLVTVNKEVDVQGRSSYIVNLSKVEQDPILRDEALQLQQGIEPGNLATYCEDLANLTTDHEQQVVWLALLASVTGGARKEYIRLLGYDPEPTVHSAQTTSQVQTTSGASSGVGTRQRADSGESSEDEETIPLPPIEFKHIDQETWSLLDDLVKNDELVAVEKLAAKGDFATAFAVAATSDTDRNYLLDTVTKLYIRSELSPEKRVIATVAQRRLTDYVEKAPLKDWKRTVALIFARESRNRVNSSLRALMRRAVEALEDGSMDAKLRLALPAIFAGDPEQLLVAIAHQPLEERLRQTVVLRHSIGGGSDGAVDLGPRYEATLLEYCKQLVANGVLEVAWRLLRNVESQNSELVELRAAVYEAIGGKNKLGGGAGRQPFDPHAETRAIYSQAFGGGRPRGQSIGGYGGGTSCQQQQSPYGAPPIPGFQPQPYGGQYGAQPPPLTPPSTAKIPAGYPPVAQPNIYGQSSYGAPSGPPPMGSSFMQQNGSSAPYQVGPPSGPPMSSFGQPQSVPPPPLQPITQQPLPGSGMDDWARRGSIPYQQQLTPPAMPPLPPQQQTTSGSAGWNDPPPLAPKQPKAPTAPVVEVNWKPLETPASGVMGQPLGTYGLTGIQQSFQQLHVSTNSPAGTLTPSPPVAAPAPLPVQLSPEDQQLVEQLHRLADAIVATNKATLTARKVEEVKTRIDSELVPRLGQGKFSPTTRSLLSHVVGLSTQGDFRGAQRFTGELSKGADFVEVSPVVHPLKTLFSLASSTWNR